MDSLHIAYRQRAWRVRATKNVTVSTGVASVTYSATETKIVEMRDKYERYPVNGIVAYDKLALARSGFEINDFLVTDIETFEVKNIAGYRGAQLLMLTKLTKKFIFEFGETGLVISDES